jgi:aspartyl-tRNA(Asn)/glutamyl-tRNA(Gln) amidotransferase subunit A
MSLTSLTLSEAAEQIAQRKLSPVELTRAYLERIEKIDPLLNSYITVTSDVALRQARVAAETIGRGLLHGIPLALKDLYDTQGIRTTAGSKFFVERVPTEDSGAAQKLNEAGAVLLGKLNLHEIALGVTNNNPHFGACKNPWRFERIPGGSSGGSGAALAAELCLGSLGSDTGGSIRIPAALCGIVGLKPTYGRVSVRGVVPLSWNLDHAGPMARRVRDVALLLRAIAGYDAQDPFSVDEPTDDYLSHIDEGIRGWRVAYAGRGHFAEADPELVAAVRNAAKVFAQLGARVNEVEIPQGREAWQANGVLTTSDAAAFHRERLEKEAQNFGADVRARLKMGAGYTSTDYALARHTQTLLRHWFARFFKDYDLLLTPTVPIHAPLRDGPDAVESARLLTRFTAPFNLTGLPALSLPCGFTNEGLPIGLQIVARPWAEAAILRAAYAYEHATEWHLRKPVL